MNLADNLLRKLDSAQLPEPLRHPIRVAKVLAHDLVRCDLIKQASAMAYTTLLSLVPSLVAIFCVLSLFSPLIGKGTDLIGELRDYIAENLASDSGEAAAQTLDSMLANLSLAKIGWSAFASVLVTLVLLLKQIEQALNRIWLVRKGRNMFARFMYFWTFLTLGVLVLALAVGATSGFDVHKLMAVEEEAKGWAGHTLSSVTSLGALFLFLFFLYKIVPNCFVYARNAAVGAALSTVLLNQGGRFYGIYVRDARNYQTLYGAMAQLPLFLMLLYMYWIIILLGALVSWRLQEGFPVEKSEDTLDEATTPSEHLRNLQVQASLPAITLLAIYRHFQQGTGNGLTGQEIAHALKLPMAWLGDALAVLTTMGYVVVGKHDEKAVVAGVGAAATEPYYPAFPAGAVSLVKLQADLAHPIEDWLTHWHHELPIDLRQALKLLAAPAAGSKASLADALLSLNS